MFEQKNGLQILRIQKVGIANPNNQRNISRNKQLYLQLILVVKQSRDAMPTIGSSIIYATTNRAPTLDLNSLMKLKTLSMFKFGFYASLNMLESNMKNKMSLDVYKKNGINSTVQLGLVGFSHGQTTSTPNTFNGYNSYGITTGSGVGASVSPTYT